MYLNVPILTTLQLTDKTGKCCEDGFKWQTRLETNDDVFCKLSMIRSSAAAAAQMRSVYNPAGENWNCFVFVFDRGILQECLEQEANTA